MAYDHLSFISGETEAYLGSTTLPESVGESESHPTETSSSGACSGNFQPAQGMTATPSHGGRAEA